jgi:hypothetical protein
MYSSKVGSWRRCFSSDYARRTWSLYCREALRYGVAAEPCLDAANRPNEDLMLSRLIPMLLMEPSGLEHWGVH